MDWRMGVAPVFAIGVLGAIVALVAWARPGAREGWAGRPVMWAGAGIVVAAFVASRIGVGPAEWVSGSGLAHAFGVVALVAAGVLGFRAMRVRRRGELLAASAPRALDDAVAEVRSSGARQAGVFKGRIASDEEVTSPGGVVCAFFDAELRQSTTDGKKGALLHVDRAAADTVWLKGERVRALVSFSLESAFAPEHSRRCTFARQMADVAGPVLADGLPPIDAVSYERIGRKGETCLVVGELRPGPAQGSYVVGGVAGGAALLVLSEDGAPTAKRLLRRAWSLFGVAIVLSAGAAWLLAM